MSHGIERAIYSYTKEFMARLLSLYCCRLHGIFTSYFLVFTLRYKYLERCHDDFFNMSKQWFINCTSARYFQEMVIVYIYAIARGENLYIGDKRIASFLNILSTRRYKNSFSRYACPWINIWLLSNCRMHKLFYNYWMILYDNIVLYQYLFRSNVWCKWVMLHEFL